MKALMISFAVLVLSGCGGSDAIGPDDGGSDVTKYDNGFECYSDNECKAGFGCVDHKCVDKPECRNDSECNPGVPDAANYASSCRSGKCVALIADDQCFGKECTGYCSACGNYTTCVEKQDKTKYCESTCRARDAAMLQISKNVCAVVASKCPNACTCYSQDMLPQDRACVPLENYKHVCGSKELADNKRFMEVNFQSEKENQKHVQCFDCAREMCPNGKCPVLTDEEKQECSW